MSLTDATTSDPVTRLPGEPARAALLIYDNGEIADDLERENALHRKLSTYLMFVESGQFTEVYPALSDAELSVEFVCSVAPTDGIKLIEGVRHPYRSDLYLPVNIAGETEFRAKGFSNINGVGTVVVEGTEGATGSVAVQFPNGSAAMNFSRNSVGPGPPYNLSTNSCVTYCGQVLGAGGVQGVPGTTRGVINFLGLGR